MNHDNVRKMTRMTPAAHRRAVETFNSNNAIGTRVRYWAMTREGEPTGEGETVTEAQMHGGDTYGVVYVKRDTGGTTMYALTHVEPIVEPTGSAA